MNDVKKDFQDSARGLSPVAEPIEPSMAVVLDRLRSSLNLYINITMETTDKLNMLKSFPPEKGVEQEEPSIHCVLDEIHDLLNRFERINQMSARNLYHLKGIV